MILSGPLQLVCVLLQAHLLDLLRDVFKQRRIQLAVGAVAEQLVEQARRGILR